MNSSQLIGYHPDINHYFLLSSPVSLLLFHLFFFFFFLPCYEIVELGTTTLGRKLGIIFAQRLLLPSDGPKIAGVAAMKQGCSAV